MGITEQTLIEELDPDIADNLCSHDPRNPYWKDLYEFSEPEEIPEPRVDCACDNCFYGRDKLALRLLEALEKKV